MFGICASFRVLLRVSVKKKETKFCNWSIFHINCNLLMLFNPDNVMLFVFFLYDSYPLFCRMWGEAVQPRLQQLASHRHCCNCRGNHSGQDKNEICFPNYFMLDANTFWVQNFYFFIIIFQSDVMPYMNWTSMRYADCLYCEYWLGWKYFYHHSLFDHIFFRFLVWWFQSSSVLPWRSLKTADLSWKQ